MWLCIIKEREQQQVRKIQTLILGRKDGVGGRAPDKANRAPKSKGFPRRPQLHSPATLDTWLEQPKEPVASPWSLGWMPKKQLAVISSLFPLQLF